MMEQRRCCHSHRSRCAICCEMEGMHACESHHATIRGRHHAFMSQSDRLRDAHSKAVLVIKQCEAREMFRVNERWGYNSHLMWP